MCEEKYILNQGSTKDTLERVIGIDVLRLETTTHRTPILEPTARATASATDDKSKASADDILAMIRARQSK